jgi:hypothetical protein
LPPVRSKSKKKRQRCGKKKNNPKIQKERRKISMNHSGDSAEQIIRISLEGVELAIRITGAAAKNIAAFLLAAFRGDGTDGKLKLKGRERLGSMLKSGKETTIFAIKQSDLRQFAIEAKRYGLVYCVLKERKGEPDSPVEIMAKKEDAGKISRIMDNLEFAAVDVADLETAPAERGSQSAEREAPDRDDTDKLLDDLLGDEGKDKTDQPESEKARAAKEQPENPTAAGSGSEIPSEPRSGTPSPSAEDAQATKKSNVRKPDSNVPGSVKEFLRERTSGAKKREDKQPERAEPEKSKTPQKQSRHQQPPNHGKKKFKKKERG